MKQKIDFTFDHGTVEGMYAFSKDHTGPLVIITNGHNGFYGYGMFPYIQDALAENGIRSYSYNFSHGGVKNGEDYFSDLDAYQKNCMRLETLDLINILRQLEQFGVKKPEKVFLLSHSLGSVPTLFAARDALKESISVSGAILIAPLKTLRVFPEDMMQKWEQDGVYYLANKRTDQMLPQGAEFLSEIKASDSTWDIEQALKETPVKYLFIHGSEDNDVPTEHSQSLKGWAEEARFDVTLEIINGAGHTLNVKHPFKGTTPELDKALEVITNWIQTTS